MLFHGQNTNYFGCRRPCFYLIYHVADVILVIWLYLSALTAWEKASMFLKLTPTSPFHCKVSLSNNQHKILEV